MKILFLCHGNICRSPMAEFVMKDLLKKAGRTDVTVESAALHTDEIGNDIHYGTRQKLTEMKIPFAPRAAWLLTAAKAREYDLLIGMDRYNLADLRRLVYPEDRDKIRLLLGAELSEIRKSLNGVNGYVRSYHVVFWQQVAQSLHRACRSGRAITVKINNFCHIATRAFPCLAHAVSCIRDG